MDEKMNGSTPELSTRPYLLLFYQISLFRNNS